MDTVKRLREIVEEKGMSLYQVAKESGVSYSTISSAKRRGGDLTVDTIERMCSSMGVSLSKFFEEQTMPT